MIVMIHHGAAGRDAGKSGGGPPQSKTLRVRAGIETTRSVLECSSPLELFREPPCRVQRRMHVAGHRLDVASLPLCALALNSD